MARLTNYGNGAHPPHLPTSLLDADPRSWDIEEVQNWVESVGFHEYRSAFAEAKIDGQQLLVRWPLDNDAGPRPARTYRAQPCASTPRHLHHMTTQSAMCPDSHRHAQSMSAEDMAKKLSLGGNELTAVIGMEIDELRERRGLLSAEELQTLHEVHPPPDKWSAKVVAGMLRDAGLDAYGASFEKAEIDGPALLRLRPAQMQELLASAVPDNPHEQNEAAAELIAALQEHLRWRVSNGRLEGDEGNKDEL